jgi:penicillin-binding protein 2
MSDVVNGPGTARRAKLPLDDVLMAGKTGTAQVVSLSVASGKSGPWKYRDHGLFIFFAPFDNPRYAGAVVIEHGGGSGAAYPIARDVVTFMFDPVKGMEALTALEKGWGGTPTERIAQKYAVYAATYGSEVPKPPAEAAPIDESAQSQSVDRPVPLVTEAATPAPEPIAVPLPPAGGAPADTTPSTGRTGDPIGRLVQPPQGGTGQ